MNEATAVASLPTAKNSVLVRMGQRFGVDPNKLYATLKETAFKGNVSNEQFLALMIVADQYNLNPLLREVFAFPDKNNGIVPVVGVDGWSRIINEHPQFDGVEFVDGPADKNGLPAWIECKIFRKDRAHPTVVREYMDECRRSTGPWSSHPRRLLRHKSLIQCARVAMSFSGIYDQDEAERIIEGDVRLVSDGAVAELNAEITGKPIDVPTQAADDAPPAGAPAYGSDAVEVAKPAAEDDGRSLTFAQVASALQAAKTGDALDLAADLIRQVPDEQQRAELDVEWRAAKKRVAKA